MKTSNMNLGRFFGTEEDTLTHRTVPIYNRSYSIYRITIRSTWEFASPDQFVFFLKTHS